MICPARTGEFGCHLFASHEKPLQLKGNLGFRKKEQNDGDWINRLPLLACVYATLERIGTRFPDEPDFNNISS
jgi:hypothetical protein